LRRGACTERSEVFIFHFNIEQLRQFTLSFSKGFTLGLYQLYSSFVLGVWVIPSIFAALAKFSR
jgi:hypothetical protein